MALLAARLFPARIELIRQLVWLENEFIALGRVLFFTCFYLSLSSSHKLAWLQGIALDSARLRLAGCRKKHALGLLLDRCLVLRVDHSQSWEAWHFFNLMIIPRELLLQSHLLILATHSILLVHLVLVLAHLLSLLDAKLLALLVPAPLVDLAFLEPSRDGNLSEAFFGPTRLKPELHGQVAELVRRLSLALADDAFRLPCQSVVSPTASMLWLAAQAAVSAALEQLDGRMLLLHLLLAKYLAFELRIILLLVLQNIVREHRFVATRSVHVQLLLDWGALAHALGRLPLR